MLGLQLVLASLHMWFPISIEQDKEVGDTEYNIRVDIVCFRHITLYRSITVFCGTNNIL